MLHFILRRAKPVSKDGAAISSFAFVLREQQDEGFA